MKPKDFVLWVQSYNERLIEQHEIARRQAYFMLAPHMDKPITMEKFYSDYWPLPGEINQKKEKEKRLIERLKRTNGSRTNEDRDSGASSESVSSSKEYTG
jgi:hypothetical protein